MTRRMTHTAQHRGQLLAMLRQLGHDLHSTYGPTADTGGLMQNHAPTIYAYASVENYPSWALDEAIRQASTRAPINW
jgi:DinB family